MLLENLMKKLYYPFTAPAAILSIKYLDAKIKIIIIGTIENANPKYTAP